MREFWRVDWLIKFMLKCVSLQNFYISLKDLNNDVSTLIDLRVHEENKLSKMTYLYKIYKFNDSLYK